jgi:hypothetical protein
VPDDASVLRVSIEALGVRDAVLSVIGQAGRSFDWILFTNEEAFEQFLEVGEAVQAGEEPTRTPTQMALTFERGADVEWAMAERAARLSGWGRRRVRGRCAEQWSR